MIPWVLSGEVNQKEIFEARNHITQLGLDGSSAKLFPANSVLVAMYGATAAQTGILRIEACTNQAVCAILPNDNLRTEYVYYFFLHHKTTLLTQAVGNAQPNISQTKIKNTLIPVPPLAEQEEIVEVLDKAFAAINQAKANIEQNIANAKELFQSKLNQIFSQKGDGWEETTLGENVELLPGYAFKSKNYTENDEGIRLLRGANIMQGYIRWEGVKRWPKSQVKEYSKFLLEENDIVLAMDRPWVSAGLKVSKIQPDDLPSLQVQRTARLRTLDHMHWNFLLSLIRSGKFIEYILGGQTGIGVPHISGKQILAFAFSLPGLKEQKVISKQIEALSEQMQSVQSHYQTKLTALEELKKSILQKAFAGELT